jgi:hypothetical protein
MACIFCSGLGHRNRGVPVTPIGARAAFRLPVHRHVSAASAAANLCWARCGVPHGGQQSAGPHIADIVAKGFAHFYSQATARRLLQQYQP